MLIYFQFIPPTTRLPSIDSNITVPHYDYLMKNTIQAQIYSPQVHSFNMGNYEI